MSLSVTITACNAEPYIARLLDSVAWADEVIIVDSGSKDRTLEIARQYSNVKIFQTDDWPGFGPQKNRALDRATSDWILALDHDEWVTPELQDEIQKAMKEPGDYSAFALPRLSSFCGRFMRHSGWYPDWLVRFFRRGAARFSEDHMHDRIIVQGKTGRLNSHFLHEPMRSLEEVLEKMNRYSSQGAAFNHARGRQASLFTAIFHGWWAFMRTYIFKAGFLDGREGFMLSVSNAEGAYYRYLKLMLLGSPKR